MRHDTLPQRLSNRPGSALVMALLVIALMTVTLAAGFALISTERRTVTDQQVQAAALGVAQQGIDAYLRHPENPAFRPGRTVHLPPRDNDTMWVPVNAVTGDTAIVIARVMRASASADTLYVLSSLGKRGVNGVLGTPPGLRAVAELATWSGAATVPIKAGWLSLSGVSKNGASGTLSGIDNASPPCVPAVHDTVAGISVPTNIPGGLGYQGPMTPLSGAPPLDNTSLGTSPQSAADSLAKTGIDWRDWSQGLNLANVWRTADHGGAFPSFADTTAYPVIYVSGDLPSLPDGQGLLVVSGSMTMNGNTHWNGIVLVGGGVTANGNDNVQGAVLSGLNTMLGGTVPIASLGNGTKTIQYNSCMIQKSLQGMRVLLPRRGTWMDNWKTY